MSIKLMGLVWGSDLPRRLKDILGKMADHADDFGRKVRPSVKTVAKACSVSERTVQRALTELLELGLLRLVDEEAGRLGGRGRATRYRIVVPVLLARQRPAQDDLDDDDDGEDQVPGEEPRYTDNLSPFPARQNPDTSDRNPDTGDAKPRQALSPEPPGTIRTARDARARDGGGEVVDREALVQLACAFRMTRLRAGLAIDNALKRLSPDRVAEVAGECQGRAADVFLQRLATAIDRADEVNRQSVERDLVGLIARIRLLDATELDRLLDRINAARQLLGKRTASPIGRDHARWYAEQLLALGLHLEEDA